ncbi:bifunctional tRNA (5-methylaminomethyl-2-thiouridine)(34)-methyltransferase MnmD/FAD-dependent 5-carboxymethylaminomethyl-2-thiouridine(34) oxidoreductase MnmC [Polaromonas naphthalenivorans]|uniref:tRNA 5-methylaminomethyl-2-thiouridine biosynthesis bifunctional protein MnmC n=1 Tax=Polaromonas naphthalenivorans (strain CJ2) TaxID=365044 RepID=MNMC_POLNA|nr:bifunctional tRNA (5-methylaminomethyl-2-thiouridine)(34)-methyltransferase MnmD/FAD-dependent 5-carboxymethylaminomethyl-2-thiouridine(34) oxidoreductase MnmC [Polaromonas naphthalenivorans]A1VQ03.1 RecName: Full=tRNA 5-methylaminomethyl-2-thiouridine biosynthesis bifunctional protein MnmC; Short=tRNA mnm(5)s(2)U biosynthesis bifunctional protein; Includes: RecName: Full=tRNA (mnm(5)s(2)U34)-methyltransferase; Includes: RecName: Full=FAD-dependent cmnm(5)s(2)U34 oxidoreductase [Polaromonas nap
MSERIEWLEDGTAGGSPYSPRFGDRYRSELGGLEQAREVFLKGCGLPNAWAGQPQWCVLETGFGLGLNFLVTWAAWKADPLRPRLLHFVSTEAYPASADDVLRSALTHPELIPFAEQLKRQLWGLLPGVHRLVFEGGQVLLTLCIGDTKAMLREPSFEADSVYLDGFSPQRNPDIWDVHTFKAVARCCRRGTRIATWTIARSVRDALAQCGFVVKKVPGTPPKRDNLQGEYQPAWEVKKSRITPERKAPARCIVIGAGLAGSAVAASLARRGWQVTVLDAASTPAAGASGLPAGVLAPHVSPDDSLLSRLSRSGIRAMLQQADALLQTNIDWSPTGVLEHCVEHARQLPAAWHPGQALADAAGDWTRPATSEQLKHCGLSPETPALWHVQAGWIKPARLVQAWLSSPGVSWHGNAAVSQLVRQAGAWQALDATGNELASAELVVLAAGHGSRALSEIASPQAGRPLALQAIRGQASWGLHAPGTEQAMPAFPVNGHGSLVPRVPLEQGLAWVTGSSFERDNTSPQLRPEDEQHNFGKLKTLLPAAAQALTAQFESGQVRGWTGVRCATPSRLPALGPLENAQDVWVCSGMGSRGLTFAALCAELLAARLHGEPLPVELRQADALLPQYATRLQPSGS